jgi:hypothetical protein
MQTVRTNLKINASSQYTNFNYNSMCQFNGETLGAGTDGLFKACCGADDNGVKIDAYFMPVMTNLGTLHPKRVWYLYLGYQCTGGLQIEITGDEETTSKPYVVNATSGKGQQYKRIPTNKRHLWTYGQFKISNILGSDFSVDLLQIVAKAIRRGGR